MSLTYKQIAADLAPSLDRLVDDWLRSDMLLGSKEYIRLEQFLWDNKVGILRVLQQHADQQKGSSDV